MKEEMRATSTPSPQASIDRTSAGPSRSVNMHLWAETREMGLAIQRTRQELQQRTTLCVPMNSLWTEDKCQSAHGGIKKMQVVMGENTSDGSG